MSINQEWQDVKAFHETFGHPVAERPVALEARRVKARYAWMQEEINEFLEAASLVDQADAMIDLIYFALGTLVEMGLPPADLFAIVHEANMTKLWADGKPHYNPEGKVIKPSHWEDPYPKLKEAIEKL